MTVRPIAVFVATSGHSGVDRVMTNLVRQWAAWGLRVDLLQVRGHGPHIADPPANLRLVDLGARHVLSALPALARYLRRERPVALLSDKDRVNRTAILARSLACSSTRLVVRLGTTLSRNLESRGPVERWVQRRSVRWLYRKADRLLVPSLGVADDLVAYTGFPREQISVVRSPIVTPLLAEQVLLETGHPWFSDRSVPVILGVGELGYRKDFETLIRAFARLRETRPCRLIILGRGRRRERLEALARELGVVDDLDLPGFHSNPYAFMARADLFVLSSRWEGMPVALIETLACRTPVVSTDCPSGPREVLGGRSVGQLVPVEDDRAMAEAMETMLDRRVPAAELEDAVSEYRVERSAADYLRVLGVEPPRSRGMTGA
ncbi:MAG: glycosyltransferase [Pseudomonadota bacterium]|nr:glycosyltransferase [Pseudomonadota bacterium]